MRSGAHFVKLTPLQRRAAQRYATAAPHRCDRVRRGPRRGSLASYSLPRRSDRGLLWINIIFLMFVAVIPFSTALLGRYHDNHFASLFYGANLILVGLALQTLWTYATTNHRLVDASLEAQTIRLGTVRLMAVPIIGALSMSITLVNVPVGMTIYVGLLVLYSWPGRWTPYWSVAPERPQTRE